MSLPSSWLISLRALQYINALLGGVGGLEAWRWGVGEGVWELELSLKALEKLSAFTDFSSFSVEIYITSENLRKMEQNNEFNGKD